MNTHPVRVAMIIKDRPELLENIGKVVQILEAMSDREFKHNRDVNEILSLKYHILHYICKDIKKQVSRICGLSYNIIHLLLEINLWNQHHCTVIPFLHYEFFSVRERPDL